MKFILFFFIGYSFLNAQSLTGVNGLFKVPNAQVLSDGSAYFGASLFPSGSYDLYGDGDKFDAMPTFVTLSLFNRIEFMFRYTHQLKQEVSTETLYFPDRMFSLRFNVLKESRFYPSVTLGMHDVSEALGGTSANPWFLATYFVASKTFETSSLIIVPTVGYAFDIIDSSISPVFDGLFGGVEISSNQLPFLSLVGEYDSKGFNAAIKAFMLDHVHISFGLLNMQDLSGFITYSFNLSNR